MEFNLINLIQVELIIIIAVTYVLGLFLKTIPNVPDWTIPFVLLAFAMVFSILYKAIMLMEGFTAQSILSGFLYGILIAGIAVFGNQLIKQATEREV
jgi:hypothetical protein